MDIPSKDDVRNYYNERVEGKLRDFSDCNPRIEAAVVTISEWAPNMPRRILEIGCGIGATAWRMARAWPQAEVIGADISPLSINVAGKCFRLPNLSYKVGVVEEGALEGKFDLILMMDVYEHIAPDDRPALHRALRSLASDEARLIFTVPTPRFQQRGRKVDPEGMQPVDEDVGVSEIVKLTSDTDTHLLYFREFGVWNYGDYAHFVLGRYQHMRLVQLREHRPSGLAGLKHRIKRIAGRAGLPDAARNYLGADVLRLGRHSLPKRFQVSMAQRRSLTATWLDSR